MTGDSVNFWLSGTLYIRFDWLIDWLVQQKQSETVKQCEQYIIKSTLWHQVMSVTELSVGAAAQMCDSVTNMLRIWSWHSTVNSTEASHHFCRCCWSNSNQLQHSYTIYTLSQWHRYTNLNPAVSCRSTTADLHSFILLTTWWPMQLTCTQDSLNQFIQ